MKAEHKLKEIEGIIWSVLRSRLDGVKIVSISIRPDVDQYGDDIFWIDIIFDTTGKRLDPRVTSTLVRRLRPRLASIGEHAFPIVSFISESDIRENRSETA